MQMILALQTNWSAHSAGKGRCLQEQSPVVWSNCYREAGIWELKSCGYATSAQARITKTRALTSSATLDQNKGNVSLFFGKSKRNDQEILPLPCSPCIVLRFTSYHTSISLRKWGSVSNVSVLQDSAPLPGFQCPMIRGALQNRKWFSKRRQTSNYAVLDKGATSVFWWWKLSGYKVSYRQVPPNTGHHLCVG